jgi:FKBP-type peptidyl-prolyl cis-trans isomerase (trigger factor)
MHTETTTTKLDHGRIEIAGTIAWEDLEVYRPTVLERLRSKIEIDGFRKGSTPDDVLIKKVGEMSILEEMAQEAISTGYIEILQKEKIDAIGRPNISITKIASGSPLEFKIVTSIMPVINLEGYEKTVNKILNNKEDTTISDEEMDTAIKELLRMRAHSLKLKDVTEGEPAPKLSDIQDDELPELDETYVQSLGDFKTIEEFKDRLGENMLHEKESKAKEKKRIEILDALVELAKIDVPEALMQYELEKMYAQFEFDVQNSGATMDEYLQQIDKTREALLEDWRPAATKRAATQLLINHIAIKEEIKSDEEKVVKELEVLSKQYQDMKDYDENRARAYVSGILLNQAVFEHLENL